MVLSVVLYTSMEYRQAAIVEKGVRSLALVGALGSPTLPYDNNVPM